MDNKACFVSFVIWLSNENFRTTIDSIFKINNDQDDENSRSIQIVIMKSTAVSWAADAEGDFSEFLPAGIDMTVAEGEYENMPDAYQAALKYVKGKYVCFTACGSSYKSGIITELDKSVQENPDIKLMCVLCDKSGGNQNAKDINKGFSGKSGQTDINEKYNVPFIFLSNLFINTSLELSFDSRLTVPEVCECDFIMRVFEQSEIVDVIRNSDAHIIPYIGSRYAHNMYEDFRDNEYALKMFFDVFVKENIERCRNKFGYIPKYVQYNIMLFLCWTVTVPGAEDIFAKVMSVEEYKKYFRAVLADIDDNVINNCNLALAYKAVVLGVKYDGKLRFVTAPNSSKIYYENTKLCEMSDNPTTIEFVTLTNKTAVIHGRIKYLGCTRENFDVFALVNGKDKIKAKDLKHSYDTFVWKENVYGGIAFQITIDLTKYDKCSIEIFSVNNGSVIKRRGLRFGKFSPLASNVPDCYYYSCGKVMTYNKNNSSIVIQNLSGFGRLKKELKYLKSLKALHNDYATHAYLARILYHIGKPFHKHIWLISDRTNRGDDNGEAFFKYMQTVKNKKIKCYFVIDKDCDEGKRLSKIGKTISTNSKRHKMYHLWSSYVISSQGNNPVVNPLLGGNIYYRDILSKMRFVFLQHGVTKDDIAGWLNLYNRNIFGFIVTTNPEYQSIFDYDYFYKPENVWLTGMPRNDLLYHDEKKYITIMPTWRKSLMTKPDPSTGIWLIRDDFKDSRYYQFYNSLLNDKRLIEAAEKYGYTICHKPHPNIEPYIDMFDHNDHVKYFAADKTYREIFAESDLMLTDYSSVAFDFAYLGKPIVYAQFDKQAFFSGEHSYTAGYFDYERDGFGDVTYDLESTVDCLIDYMKNGCKPKEKYLERIHNTFAFLDTDCCKRVYEKLMEYEKF
ncbi:MAG: CDP-glycerol glycerophosphotransferase family protein [Clostridia bacterium]|nr:CDP-glycerol glycerophosphotransferase family protein [Clostridia bacterium]